MALSDMPNGFDKVPPHPLVANPFQSQEPDHIAVLDMGVMGFTLQAAD